MKKHYKFIAGIMAVSLVFGVGVIPESIAPVVSITANAEQEYTKGTYGELIYYNYGDHIVIADCDESATEVVIPPEIDGVPVTSIGSSAFYKCESLTSIDIPDSVTSIRDFAFYDCNNLKSIKIPYNLTDIGVNAFFGTQWLKEKQAENPLVIINDTVVDGRNCTGKVVIPDSVTYIVTSAFGYCYGLTSVKLPSSITKINDSTFMYCHKLKSIEIPDGVTSIGRAAFFECIGLETVKLPDSLTSIEELAFSDCRSLMSIEIPSGVTNLNVSQFNSDNKKSMKVTILNPACKISNPCEDVGVICGYENSTAQAYAEEYGYEFESLGKAPEKTGDMNGDGDFNVSDVVTFQKYILGTSDEELSDWKQADLNYDGLLDSFDLVMMRKKLIEK
ncbi:MAG: leucine-rich repeat protein [Ruminococcus sp.]|nr:leucine-rich repeat protein [Ruminococcus sp.]